jgi:hypothetical protein
MRRRCPHFDVTKLTFYLLLSVISPPSVSKVGNRETLSLYNCIIKGKCASSHPHSPSRWLSLAHSLSFRPFSISSGFLPPLYFLCHYPTYLSLVFQPFLYFIPYFIPRTLNQSPHPLQWPLSFFALFLSPP